MHPAGGARRAVSGSVTDPLTHQRPSRHAGGQAAYRPDIDGLRAVAILSVMLFHLDVPGFSGGFVGVDVFFVISGYLITRNLVGAWQKGRWSFQDFYGRRVRRLFPALYLTVSVSFVFAFLLVSPHRFLRLAESILYTSVLLPNVFYWMHTGYFAPASRLDPLLHLWSLGIEEQFYLLWPLLLLALLRAPRVVAVILVLAAAGLSTMYGQRWLATDTNASFYLPFLRCAGLAVGAALALAGRRYQPVGALAGVLLLIGLGTIAVAVAGFDEYSAYPGVNALVPVLGAALAIYAGEAPTIGHLLRNRVMVAIGLISYSLYLIHWPVLVFYTYWVLRPLGAHERIGIAVFSLLAAAVMYQFVEQPFRAGPRKRFTTPGFACACLALTLPLMFAAATVWAGKGLPWRVPHHTPGLQDSPVECRRAKKTPGCFLGIEKPVVEDVLLIGDSHAYAISAGIDRLARDNGLKVRRWDVWGCPPLFDVEIINHDRARHSSVECGETTRAWKAYIEARRPKIVILAARWTAITESGEYGLARPGGKLIQGVDQPLTTHRASRALFPEVLEHTVATITSFGSKVVVFGQAPELGVPLSACRDVPPYLLTPEQIARRCDLIPYEQMMDRIALGNETIAGLASADVLPLLASDALCDRAKHSCKFFRKGRPLYRDFHHLNTLGSLTVAEHFEPAFAAFLRHAGIRREGQSPKS
jgi:peptidoglycan/LPS O-acetylase OafA/YrhL